MIGFSSVKTSAVGLQWHTRRNPGRRVLRTVDRSRDSRSVTHDATLTANGAAATPDPPFAFDSQQRRPLVGYSDDLRLGSNTAGSGTNGNTGLRSRRRPEHDTPTEDRTCAEKTSVSAFMAWLLPAVVAVCCGAGEPDAAAPGPAAGPIAVPAAAAAAAEQPASRPDDSVRPAPAGWTRLSPTDEVWIDTKNKRVLVGGKICFRQGMLEMFACPEGTKEHESIVAVKSKAFLVHTALLAVGAQPGRPAQYEPQYTPASGPRIAIEVVWKNEQGQTVRRPAQQMILNVKTRKPMEQEWVFAGSGFWQDEADGERYYLAEAGELICVSNFSSALLDLPIESSQNNAQLLFEANTDNIPPLGTAVRLLLTPQLEETKPK